MLSSPEYLYSREAYLNDQLEAHKSPLTEQFEPQTTVAFALTVCIFKFKLPSQFDLPRNFQNEYACGAETLNSIIKSAVSDVGVSLAPANSTENLVAADARRTQSLHAVSKKKERIKSAPVNRSAFGRTVTFKELTNQYFVLSSSFVVAGSE